MRAELIRIGNSRGIRIPKPLIEQCRLGDVVELRVEDERLIISTQHPPRYGWEEAFRVAASYGSDPLLLASVPRNQFDLEEWKW